MKLLNGLWVYMEQSVLDIRTTIRGKANWIIVHYLNADKSIMDKFIHTTQENRSILRSAIVYAETNQQYIVLHRESDIDDGSTLCDKNTCFRIYMIPMSCQ